MIVYSKSDLVTINLHMLLQSGITVESLYSGHPGTEIIGLIIEVATLQELIYTHVYVHVIGTNSMWLL